MTEPWSDGWLEADYEDRVSGGGSDDEEADYEEDEDDLGG